MNGRFAFAWYRPLEQTVLLARDRWGKKPLFWPQEPIEVSPGRWMLVDLTTSGRGPHLPVTRYNPPRIEP